MKAAYTSDQSCIFCITWHILRKVLVFGESGVQADGEKNSRKCVPACKLVASTARIPQSPLARYSIRQICIHPAARGSWMGHNSAKRSGCSNFFLLYWLMVPCAKRKEEKSAAIHAKLLINARGGCCGCRVGDESDEMQKSTRDTEYMALTRASPTSCSVMAEILSVRAHSFVCRLSCECVCVCCVLTKGSAQQEFDGESMKEMNERWCATRARDSKACDKSTSAASHPFAFDYRHPHPQ